MTWQVKGVIIVASKAISMSAEPQNNSRLPSTRSLLRAQQHDPHWL
jgi:hypothetical protein